MECDGQEVVVGLEGGPHGPPQRGLGQIERSTDLVLQTLLPLRRSERLPVDLLPRQCDVLTGEDVLQQHFVLLHQRGPQDLLPLLNQLQTSLQSCDIHGSLQSIDRRHVVGGRFRQRLLQHPQPLLAEGHR